MTIKIIQISSYLKGFSTYVRIHMSRTHAASLVRFIANRTLEWAFISTKSPVEKMHIRLNASYKQWENENYWNTKLTYAIGHEW